MKIISNPANRFLSEQRELIDSSSQTKITVYHEHAKSILSRNDSPDLPFRWSLNPYRGCFHACAYCYARPTHEYWGFGAGTDFDSKLVAKTNAPQQLQHTLNKRSWKGELIVFSGNTDCYQPIESTYRLTRACLAVCQAYHNPVGIITKSPLILHDQDILHQLHNEAWLRVYFSIPFAKNETARKVEPQAPSISRRFEAMEQLSRLGIPTAVSLAPIIPGLNEEDIPTILRMAHDAGATTATYSLLRLNGNVEPVFIERMTKQFPDRIQKILNRLRELRHGAVSEEKFFARQNGHGTTWHIIEQLFQLSCKQLGFRSHDTHAIPHTFRRPGPQQTHLFHDM
ncbi:MAG: radical SAM protein [Nitrospirales bacterium]|nr:MAG: radical SAM protein [Nitrospirales bacterium]